MPLINKIRDELNEEEKNKNNNINNNEELDSLEYSQNESQINFFNDNLNNNNITNNEIQNTKEENSGTMIFIDSNKKEEEINKKEKNNNDNIISNQKKEKNKNKKLKEKIPKYNYMDLINKYGMDCLSFEEDKKKDINRTSILNSTTENIISLNKCNDSSILKELKEPSNSTDNAIRLVNRFFCCYIKINIILSKLDNIGEAFPSFYKNLKPLTYKRLLK